LKPLKQLSGMNLLWRDHPDRRAARVTEMLKGQLPRTAQNLRKSRNAMASTTAVSMGITLLMLQQTATQQKIATNHRQGRQMQFFKPEYPQGDR
jgi:hypothetical protein